MIQIAAEKPRIAMDYEGNVTVSFSVSPESKQALRKSYDWMQGKKLNLEIKKWSKGRTLDANAYLWVLCGKIAEKVGITKEEVYRKLVRDAGEYEVFPIKKDKVSDVTRMWGNRGLGWSIEIIGDSKIEGYVNGMCFFGSSVYNTEQMSRLIDDAVSTAEDLGIHTYPESTINEMKEKWGAKNKSV